jgi:zinc/manganese transport system permease protein
LLVPVLSALFATTSMVGGILLALGTTVPISPYVTTVSFAIYAASRTIARVRRASDRRISVDASASA